MFFVTIVCRCGNHNHVHDEELERAVCTRCDSALLRPAKQEAPAAQVEPLEVRVHQSKPILAS